MSKYDDVLTAADDYRFSKDATITHKARWALENAITEYAQYWSDEQNKAILEKVILIKEVATNAGLYDYPVASIKEYASRILDESKIEDAPCYVKCIKDLQSKYDAREKEAHELSEKIIALRSEIKARNNEQNSLEEQRDHNAECVKLRDDKIKLMDEALKAARLLCANLRHGGVGHMALVENFEKFDNET